MRKTTGVLMLLSSLTIGAQDAKAPPPPRDCSAPEHRQFDFWIGDWNVVDAKGQPQGTNDVTRELGGCVLQEHWRSADGKQVGTSFNNYDEASRKWYQTWVDSTAGFLLLSGGLDSGRMVLSGDMTAPGGGRVTHRIAWEKLAADGSRVRQLWESSRDGGKTWRVVFDGTYVRK